jgi:hypothetical protein
MHGTCVHRCEVKLTMYEVRGGVKLTIYAQVRGGVKLTIYARGSSP